MKWVVAINKGYYPEVTEFDTFEAAKKDYDWEVAHETDGWNAITIYLCEVKETMKYEDTE